MVKVSAYGVTAELQAAVSLLDFNISGHQAHVVILSLHAIMERKDSTAVKSRTHILLSTGAHHVQLSVMNVKEMMRALFEAMLVEIKKSVHLVVELCVEKHHRKIT